MLRNKKGFTLIEMLVVIAIIAVLVAIVMPIVGQSTIQAKAATDVANLRAVYAELNIRVISGDLTQQSVEEILNSPRARAMVDGFSCRKATEELCRKCGYARRFG